MNLNRAGSKRLKAAASTLAAALAVSLAISPAGTALAGPGGDYAEPGGPKPNTTFTSKPSKTTKSNKATFRFVSSVGSTTFKCKVDKAGWAACKSPLKLKNLKPGKHTLKVKGDRLGTTETSPASFTWTIKK